MLRFIIEHAVFGSSRATAFLTADFFLCLLTGRFFSIADFLKAFTEFATCKEAIELSGALLLAFYLDAAGDVLEVNTRGSFIDLLAATAATLNEFFC